MFGLLMGLFVPHGEAITWGGYWYNLGLATLGNVIGGAVFVGGLYWLGSPKAREAARAARKAAEDAALEGDGLTPAFADAPPR
jgi:nitrite transporter NirC